jgi:hypothetical protein
MLRHFGRPRPHEPSRISPGERGVIDMPFDLTRKLIVAGVTLTCMAVSSLAAQAVFTKVQVGDRIRKVENGVDEFRKWAENRADQSKSNAQTAKTSGRTRGRTATQTQKDVAHEKKDELDDALGDLNRSTNRLRRTFDPTDKWIETRPQMEQVLDDGRKINQVIVRGKYGTQAERYWAVLRGNINDLARCYNLTPLGA